MKQALRLELKNTSLLREIAVAYIAINKLNIAEDLIRRTLVIETSTQPNSLRFVWIFIINCCILYTCINSKGGNPATRKLLADVLAGQNQAIEAINEYQSILSDDNSDTDLKIIVAEKCIPLLESLGRYEDISSVKKIIESLQK